MIFGPFSLSAEYAVAWGTDVFENFDGVRYSGPRGDPVYQAFYVEAGCFLTPGDGRRFDRKTATWDRTVPEENAVGVDGGDGRWCFGRGAVEVLARLSYLDLVSGSPTLTPASRHGRARAGRQRDVTLGLNWYLNPQTRLHGQLRLDARRFRRRRGQRRRPRRRHAAALRLLSGPHSAARTQRKPTCDMPVSGVQPVPGAGPVVAAVAVAAEERAAPLHALRRRAAAGSKLWSGPVGLTITPLPAPARRARADTSRRTTARRCPPCRTGRSRWAGNAFTGEVRS